MAKRAATYRIYDRDKRGLAWIDVRSIPGFPRIREPLTDDKGRSIPYRDARTGRSPSRAAEEAAARRHADLIRGRVVAPSNRVLTAETDQELVALWLDAIETPQNKASVDVKATYGRTWHRFFDSEAKLDDGTARWNDRRTALERMTDEACLVDYATERLRSVLRKTVRKEISALMDFLGWAKTHRKIAEVPARPALPKSNPGVRSGRQRAKPVDITPEEAGAIILALPEWSKAAAREKAREGQAPFRVRAPMEFMWEMTWRGATVERLSVPRNWSPGCTEVELHDEDDKARYGRTVRLTPRAMEILKECAPKSGLIFGRHDYRRYVKDAAKRVLDPIRAERFARYDFRHGRINAMLEATGDMLGTAYVAGHKQLTTTNAYLRAQKRQGDAVIEAMSGDRPTPGGGTMRAHSPKTDPETSVSQSGREDSNLRPLDPQRIDRAKSRRFVQRERVRSLASSRQESQGDASVGARCGHAYLDAAASAIAREEDVWSAFDRFTMSALEADYEGGLQ
jgi:hypothetical protein